MTYSFFADKLKIAERIYKKKGLKGIWFYAFRHIRVWMWSPLFLILSIFSSNSKDRFFDLISFTKDLYRTEDIRKIIKLMKNKGEARDLKDLDITKIKKSDRIFLLASGSTVNDLTPQDWEHIGKYDSIGFNHWLIHDFIPTYYFFEAIGGTYLDRHNEQERSSSFNIWLTWLKYREEAYAKVPFICDYKVWYDYTVDFKDLPEKFRDNLYLYAAHGFRATSVSFIKLVLLFCLYMDYFKLFNYNWIIKHRATINGLITFAMLAGYKEIIIIGADLKSKDYFWEVNPESYNSCPLPNKGEPEKHHSTYDVKISKKFHFCLPVDVFMDMLERFILRPYGVKLYIASRKSALYPRFPLYTGFKENQDINKIDQ
ncbi:MAG TPA: hypothetical protein PL110_20160 [Candidatus Eremiobacteraeota bacterium]|nr:MAG: hypothetical protein BWY64_02483 [bacterium ADurb.Bin363]HPZ10415.1 hypothetical protein [Candidatus Eremiobacteraeota bacterium]